MTRVIQPRNKSNQIRRLLRTTNQLMSDCIIACHESVTNITTSELFANE